MRTPGGRPSADGDRVAPGNTQPGPPPFSGGAATLRLDNAAAGSPGICFAACAPGGVRRAVAESRKSGARGRVPASNYGNPMEEFPRISAQFLSQIKIREMINRG
jgi:hypothetical protein